MIEQLSSAEQRTLEACEGDIEKGKSLQAKALKVIRDQRLYRQTHSTFEDYCQERWGIDRRDVNRAIQHVVVIGNLENDESLGQICPKIARDATREIASLPPDQQIEVVKLASDNGKKKPTAKAMAEAREMLYPSEPVCIDDDEPRAWIDERGNSVPDEHGRVDRLPDETEEERKEREARERLAQISVDELMESATVHANDAIDCLRKIRPEDPRREDAFGKVVSWIRRHRKSKGLA